MHSRAIIEDNRICFGPNTHTHILTHIPSRTHIYTQTQVNSVGASERNAEIVAKKIKEMHEASGGRKIVALCHSKGGIDFHYAIGKFPELANIVAGGSVG